MARSCVAHDDEARPPSEVCLRREAVCLGCRLWLWLWCWLQLWLWLWLWLSGGLWRCLWLWLWLGKGVGWTWYQRIPAVIHCYIGAICERLQVVDVEKVKGSQVEREEVQDAVLARVRGCARRFGQLAQRCFGFIPHPPKRLAPNFAARSR